MLQLAIENGACSACLLKGEWLEQESKVPGDASRTVAMHKAQIALFVLVVRNGEHATVSGEQFDAFATIRAVALPGPARRIGTPDPEKRILRLRKCQVRT